MAEGEGNWEMSEKRPPGAPTEEQEKAFLASVEGMPEASNPAYEDLGKVIADIVDKSVDDKFKAFGEKIGGLERMVWAAAYANEFARSLDFILTYKSNQTIDNVSGFACAEIADVAVEKLREALTGDDKEYLLPVKEGWK